MKRAENMFNNITGQNNKFSDKIHTKSPIVGLRDDHIRPIENYLNGNEEQVKGFKNNKDIGIYKPLMKNVDPKKDRKGCVNFTTEECLSDIIVDDHQFHLDSNQENKIYSSTNPFTARKSVEYNIERWKALEATLKKFVSRENHTDYIDGLEDKTANAGSDYSADSDTSLYKEIVAIPLEKFPNRVSMTSITSEYQCAPILTSVNNDKKSVNVLLYEESCEVCPCIRKASKLLKYDSDDAIVRKSFLCKPQNSESTDMFADQDLECYCSADDLPVEESESIQEIKRLIKLLKETDCSTDIYDKGDMNTFPEILEAEELLVRASQETIFIEDYDKSSCSFIDFCKTSDVVHGILFFTFDFLIRQWKLKCVNIIV